MAATTEIGPTSDLSAEIAKLGPGDELVLQGGTYTLSAKLTIGVKGTAAAPITIRSKDGEVAHVTRDASQNVINVEKTEYVLLNGLEVSGGSHGIRIDDSSFITVEDCEIHHTEDVGLSANVPNSTYEGLTIRRNHIHDTGGTGEGMYLGCNNGGCTMFDSLIEGNYVHNTNGPTVQQGDGIELKQGSYNNIIRDNVIHDTNYPCILVYGTAGKPVNLVERNAMWGCLDNAIQAEADVIIRNNIILGAGGDGIHSRNHQQNEVKDLTIVHNTVVNTGAAIRTQNVAGKVVIANNALYSQNGNAISVAGDLAQVTVKGNVGKGGMQGPSAGFDGSGDITADFEDADYTSKRNVYPKAGGKLIAAGDPTFAVEDDFNGTPRAGSADVGAYKFDGSGNPQPPVVPGFKNTPGGAGVGGSGAAGGGTGGGSGAMGGASGSGAGSGNSGGSSGARAGGSDEESGCGCRVVESQREWNSGWLFVVALLLLQRRRQS